ncbi:hypothetical protein OG874_00110 [Nocardia sp. NBC_00565]|uniref:hypothetical protein n=1 Tax=Nocardia sp. NBC_00565 TaxID=2975993 RepID=UPI002E802ED7|nr:hypothetical protein [Nocardia sp. NBC_00565]WUC03657.1 hypothetical protein OG874_00110 [Nocardia sp. NBC_00565]
MTGLWLALLGRGWELVAVGFLMIAVAAIILGPGDDYSCAPAREEDDGEEIPYDPDRQRDWDIADRMEAM